MTKNFLFIVLAFGTFFCKSPKAISDAQTSTLLDSLEKSGYSIYQSPSKEYHLAIIQVAPPKTPAKPKSIFLILNSQKKVIFQNEIFGDYVKWNNDNQVEFYSIPNIMPSGTDWEDMIQIYDPISQKVFKKIKQSKDK